jgi:NADH-quinone oxidoreductase subunit G
VLGESGNSVGAALTGLLPQGRGKSAGAMVKAMPRGMIVLHVEPARDMAQGAQAEAALRGVFSVALTPFRSAAESWASVMLPISPFTETSGTFINTAGLAQSFHATVKPLGQTRPGWKVLRVLANIMALPGFQQESSEAIRDEVLGQGSLASRLNSTVTLPAVPSAMPASSGLERVAEVPIYHSDAVVRRAVSLQATPAAKVAAVRVHPDTAAQLGLTSASQVRVKGLSTVLSFATDISLPAGAVRIPLGLSSTVAVGAAHGHVELERA